MVANHQDPLTPTSGESVSPVAAQIQGFLLPKNYTLYVGPKVAPEVWGTATFGVSPPSGAELR